MSQWLVYYILIICNFVKLKKNCEVKILNLQDNYVIKLRVNSKSELF